MPAGRPHLYGRSEKMPTVTVTLLPEQILACVIYNGVHRSISDGLRTVLHRFTELDEEFAKDMKQAIAMLEMADEELDEDADNSARLKHVTKNYDVFSKRYDKLDS